MTSISIELVPRSYEDLESQIISINKEFPQIDTLNVPDLFQFSIRSWEACKKGINYFKRVVPHIRAIDFNLREPLKLFEIFLESGLNSVLIVTGDKPQDMSKKVYRNTSLELIRILKREYPQLTVYAAIDPYRSSIINELNYVYDKLDAGADGFFTQPFFDVRFLEIYLEQLQEFNVFWGVCPVTNEKSKNYWESKNNVVFPKNFKPTLEYNIELAKNILNILKKQNSNIYFMPIRVEPIEYLRKVFNNDEFVT